MIQFIYHYGIPVVEKNEYHVSILTAFFRVIYINKHYDQMNLNFYTVK